MRLDTREREREREREERKDMKNIELSPLQQLQLSNQLQNSHVYSINLNLRLA